MSYLDNSGLLYFFGKLKAMFGSQLTVSGRTVTLKSKSGATLSTITTQDTSLIGKTVTLPNGGWSGSDGAYTYTAAVSGVTTSNTVIVQAAPSSLEIYRESGISCTAQASGTLTFTAKTVPSTSVQVYVAINST